MDRRSCAIARAVARKNRRKSCHSAGYTFPWHTIQNILRIVKLNFFAYVKVKTIQSFRSHLQGPRSVLTLEERTVTLSQNMGNKYLIYTDAAQYPRRANSSTYFYFHKSFLNLFKSRSIHFPYVLRLHLMQDMQYLFSTPICSAFFLIYKLQVSAHSYF